MQRRKALRGLGMLLWHTRIGLLYAAAYCWRRLLFRTTFIAITGSVGKTTAKECLAAALGSRFPVVATLANQNDYSGVPRSILRVRPWHRFAVLEVAGNGHGVMKRSARLVAPDVAVILSVARTHMREHRTLESVASEKARLLVGLRPRGVAVLNGDDPRVASMAPPGQQRIVRFGSSPEFDFWSSGVTSRWPGRLSFELHAGSDVTTIRTQLVGEHWRNSVLGAIAAASVVGMNVSDIAAAMATVEPTPGRMQPVEISCGAVFLRDEFNGSVDTLKCAFDALAAASAGRRILVMSDVSDSSQSPHDRLRRIGREAAAIFDGAIFIGDGAHHGVHGAVRAGMQPEHAREFVSLEQAQEFLSGYLRVGDLVLLRGRATDHLSRLFHALHGTGHCREPLCRKTVLCDFCPELVGGRSRAPQPSRARLAEQGRAGARPRSTAPPS